MVLRIIYYKLYVICYIQVHVHLSYADMQDYAVLIIFHRDLTLEAIKLVHVFPGHLPKDAQQIDSITHRRPEEAIGYHTSSIC